MGRPRVQVTEESYIRQLPFSVIKYLSILLDIDNSWQRLALEIPRSLADIGKGDCEKRYSQMQVRVFETKLHVRDGSATRAILDDWATQNTKVKHLLKMLQVSALYEAADYIAVSVLHGEKVHRPTPAGQSISHLPIPSWGDQDQNSASNKSEKIDDLKKDLVNFNVSTVKDVYQQDKNACFNSKSESDSSNNACSEQDHTYNSLQKDCKEDRPYNNLASEKPPDPLSYNRMPSYDSGGQLSALLKSANQQERGAQEHEETFQVRPLNESLEAMKLNGAPAEYKNPLKAEKVSGSSEEKMIKNREPDEMDDGSSKDSSLMKTIYVCTGSKQMDYNFLARMTDNFNQAPATKGGRVIGTGGFGEVFLGIINNGFKVAVKRLKDTEGVDKQFVSELENLVKYSHKNIVRLLGYSIDGLSKCLVYEFLCNGSLEDRLMKKDGTPPLSNATRLSILQGTAEGIHFLNSNGVVHRDIKSANVLLDENFDPKVGDFATARVGPRGNATMAMQTQVVIGTVAYLAPEARLFDVSTKLDSYSFGIVILEVLTSLPAMDERRKEVDIKSYVDENDIEELLDEEGGVWDEEVVRVLMEISDKCTELKKKTRVNVGDIKADLMALSC